MDLGVLIVYFRRKPLRTVIFSFLILYITHLYINHAFWGLAPSKKKTN